MPQEVEAVLRHADPDDFAVEAGLIDWDQILKLRGGEGQASMAAIPGTSFTVRSSTTELPGRVTDFGVVRRGVHLHWNSALEIGLPNGPFTVWRRRKPNPGESSFPGEIQLQGFVSIPGPNGTQIFSLGASFALVRVQCNIPDIGAVVIGWSGNPGSETWVDVRTRAVPGDGQFIDVAGDALTGLVVSPGVSVTAIHAVSAEDAANAPDWTAVETVGLPGTAAFWAGHGDHGVDQGFLIESNGIAGGLTSASVAASNRYRRGLPAIGWPALMAPGVSAPNYSLPSAGALFRAVNSDGTRPMLHMIRDLLGHAPAEMMLRTEVVEIPPPQNSAGVSAATESTTAEIRPLELLLGAVATDPLLSLLLGYGTTIPEPITDSVSLLRPFDYMITGDWRPNPQSREIVRRAALALRPRPALAGATPVGLQALASVVMMPSARDGNWRRSVRLAWQRPPATDLYRVASVAVAAREVAPQRSLRLLNEAHDPEGFLPIAAASSTNDPDGGRVSVVDPSVDIPAPRSRLENGSKTMAYGAVTQTIFGLWGNWSIAEVNLVAPAPDRVRILNARLDASAVPSGPCPGVLSLDFAWDWSIRAPQSISFRGDLYAQLARSDAPQSDVPADGFPLSLGGNGGPIEVSFSGDEATSSTASIVALNEAGDEFVSFGAAQGDGVRRYRMTVEGFSLDFDAATHIGLAMWAHVVERREPNRIGPWPERPHLTAVSDPRPPAISVDHVELASLPDANGESHARLSWPANPAAVGYIIYESSETTLRTELGLGERAVEATHTERLTEIQNLLINNSARNAFTRRNSTLVTGTSLDVTLPRGSTEIHFFTVLAQTGAGIASDWPSGSDAVDRLIGIAVPRIAKPQPPILEVSRVLDPTEPHSVAGAQVTVTPRLGHRAHRVLVYRTRIDRAARHVDSMGPPIADLATSENGWTVEVESLNGAPPSLTSVRGTDQPDGSWRRVWYRAVAWSDAEPDRALLAARSDASPAQAVVIPPADAPELSSIQVTPGPGGAGTLLASWSSAAPVQPTPLGPHRMSIDARASGFTESVLVDESAVDALAGSEDLARERWQAGLTPEDLQAGPVPTPSLWWREGEPDEAGIQVYRARLRRPDSEAPVSIQVRLADPLGRSDRAFATFDASDL